MAGLPVNINTQMVNPMVRYFSTQKRLSPPQLIIHYPACNGL
jgi:hypothetical protein